MRYFIKLSYDGSAFSGWQSQPDASTVQQTLEDALSKLLRCRISVTGAGRTDSGVSAVGYVAHFDYDYVIDTAAFGYKLNAILPRSIVIHDVRQVPTQGASSPAACPGSPSQPSCPGDGPSDRADCHGSPSLPTSPGSDGAVGGAETGLRDLPHARFSAKRREYTYFLHRTKDPFVERFSWFCPWGLDVAAMNEAARALLGTHDFSCFEKVGSDNRTSICTVTEAFWAAYVPAHVAIMGFSPACTKPLPAADCPETSDGNSGSPSDGDSESLSGSDCQVTAGEGYDTPSGCSESLSGWSQLTTFAGSSGGGQANGCYLYFRISADRFLRNMVRAIVGSLVDVGRGRRSVSDFAALVLPAQASAPDRPLHQASRRSLAGESVPGHALFLSEVDY